MKIILMLLLFTLSFTYLQLPLKRVPGNGKPTITSKSACVLGQQQVCYQKDIAWCIQLIHNERIYSMAIDFTIPISWIKNKDCVTDTGAKCKLVENSFSQSIRNEIKTIKNKIRRVKNENSQDSTPKSSQKYTLSGIHSIQGTIQKGQNVQFWTRDSNKLVSLYKLFLVGLFMSGEKDKMYLENTNFINATKISKQTSQLSDGAISMRFDSQSQNSFLYQIFDFVAETQKTLTIYIGSNSAITIGDLSTKNAELGYSSITWLPLNTQRQLMIDQIVIQTIGSEKVNSFETSSEAVFTLSASYIGIPQKYLSSIIKILDAQCQINKDTLFVHCSNPSKTFWKKRIIFQIIEAKIVLQLQQLFRDKEGKNTILHLRQSQNDKIIMGQPFFKKHYSAFDYVKNRIGIAERRKSQQQKILDVITLIRFLTVILILGCCTIFCFKPIQRIIKIVGIQNKIEQNQQDRYYEKRSLKYSQIQPQTPQEYDKLNSQIQNALDEDIQGI